MIYLDNAATTKILPEILNAMMPYLTDNYGNAGSLHKLGRDASNAVEKARQQVADFLNCQPENIIFTSGGSEANNLAIKGIAPYLLRKGKTGIATSAVEHDSVFNALRDLKRGFYPITIPVDRCCICDSTALEDSLRAMSNSSSPIGLVSVMYANNITGAINNVEKLASIAHNKGAMFHTDCVQAAGFNELDVKKMGCDFLSLSGHKIHAPKGVGALYVKDRSKLSPLISGGSAQEFGLRGGTENVAGIVGFGKACEIANNYRIQNHNIIEVCRKEFAKTLYSEFRNEGMLDMLSFNAYEQRGKIVNFRVDSVDAQVLLLLLDIKGVCVSAGSACQSRESKANKTLLAIGLTEEQARQSVRVSFSKCNVIDEARVAARRIVECVQTIQGLRS
jgi:cysteine desulfurase